MSHLDDELDRRLSEAGESWRAQEPLLPVRLPQGRRRPAWVAPLAAAASVALLAGGAAIAADVLGDHKDSSSPADTDQERWDPDLPPGLLPADVPGAVPPVNQVVRFPKAEAAGVYRPRPSEAEGVRDCSADDLRFTATSDDVGSVVLRLAAKGDVRCSVGQLPFLQYEKDGKPAEVPTSVSDPKAGDWPASVVVRKDQDAVVQVSWAGWCASAEPVTDTIQLFFTDNSDLTIPSPTQDPCPGTDFVDGDMHYSGWAPEGFTFEPITSMPITATLVDTVEGPRGLPTWVVELTASRDVDLSTCPSWEVRQGAEDSASWRLNCAAVPDKRADGTPYLPADKPVRFAVWVPYGGTDAALDWRLTTVDGPVVVPLTEGPEAPTGEARRVIERDANLHLYLSIFDQSERFSVSIDGSPVVDELDVPDGGSGIRSVHLAVPAGEHTMEVRTDQGLRRTVRLNVPAHGDLWGNFEVNGSPARPDGGSIDWRVQDSPLQLG